jgi:hypothetical protein
MLISPRSPNSPIPTGCGGAAMRTAVSAGSSPVSHRREQPGAAGPAGRIPPRNLPGLGPVPGRPLPCSRYWARHVVWLSAGTAGPGRGSRALATTRTPWCRATADDSPAASTGDAEAKDQARMSAASGRPRRPSPSRRAEALAGCASAGGSLRPRAGTVNAGQAHRSSRAQTRARVRAAVRHGSLRSLVRPGPSHKLRAGALSSGAPAPGLAARTEFVPLLALCMKSCRAGSGSGAGAQPPACARSDPI